MKKKTWTFLELAYPLMIASSYFVSGLGLIASPDEIKRLRTHVARARARRSMSDSLRRALVK